MPTTLRSRTVLATLAIVVSASGSIAQPDPRAQAALERSAQALAEIDSFTVNASHAATGGLGNLFPVVEGRILAARVPGSAAESDGTDALAPLSYRLTGKGQRNKNADALEFDVVYHHGRFEWLDHEAKMLRSRSATARRLGEQSVALARAIVPEEVFAPTPYADMMNHDALAMGESSEIDGKSYTVVTAPIDERRIRHLYLDPETHLPRRLEVRVDAQLISGTYHVDFADLKPGADVEPATFKLETPEGYRRERSIVERPDGLDPLATNPRAEADAPREESSNRAEARPVRRSAPAFSLENPQGKTVTLESLRGNILVLDFWATWCVPCLKASPEVQKLHEDYADRPVRVIGMNFRQANPQDAIDYMNEHEYTYGLLLRADDARRDYDVSKFPSYVIVDARGRIIETITGYKEGETFPRIREIIDAELERMTGQTTDPAQAEG